MRSHQVLYPFMTLITAIISIILLFPQQIPAGSLNPSAPPGPTMKSLDEIPPTWSQKLDSTNGSTAVGRIGCGSSRFECLWNEGSPISIPQAVLDKETGLVWERSPDTEEESWYGAFRYCYRREVSNRKGWHLPTVEELASLVDNDNYNPSLPSLPTGHPFTNVQPDYYWTSTSSSEDFTWFVDFEDGHIGWTGKAGDQYVWCVRGGTGLNENYP